MDITVIKGSTVYDMWIEEDGYIHIRFISQDGKGREIQFDHDCAYDRSGNSFDLSNLPIKPLGGK